MLQIAVIGAGIVGLSTAVNIIDAGVPGIEVTIISEQFSPHTTSDGAAGIFTPRLGYPGFDYGVPLDVFRQWSKESFLHFHKIAYSSEAREAGVVVVSGYSLFTKKENIPVYTGEDVMYNYRQLSPEELKRFPDKYKYGYFVTTTVTESLRYLPWLMKKFKAKGGRVVKKKVKSMAELIGHYDIAVNCTGLGSAQLLGDSKLIPVRGQVVRVKAPWVKHAYFTDSSCYIYPCFDTVVLGGIKARGEWDTSLKDTEKELFMKNCLEILPSLKDAEPVMEWAGLRPLREPIRIEKDTVESSSGISIPVVHNYGHGADGIAISWGTAVAATKLVKEIVTDLRRQKACTEYTDGIDKNRRLSKL